MSDSLKDRREQLMWQRRWKRLRSCWQFVCVCGLTGGMVWMMSWPEWSIRSNRQVEFLGNKLVSRETLYEDLDLEYPQAIWQLSTQALGDELAKNPALLKVEVTRQLLPAQVNVAVQERQPVAIAVADQGLGYLDGNGNYIPATLYSQQVRNALPQTPQFLGYGSQYRSFWQTHQVRIQQSPVNIRIINGNNPTNISLTTDLGLVFLGSDLSQFERKLQVLEKMQNLPSRVPKERLLFIDLTNADSPSIRLRPQVAEEKVTVSKP
ncbi:cell division protein FtsQ/DivIB [Synechocystis sp. PCC 6714]|uniref:cell division protein FtsQ/DivIB n=1 Tax=Synechocystis sp. (strain PCC 6714) TaxID=1147 RepID=UPI001EE64ABF|nr:cell division protein FtsQ/DivIB [Synechocystis sp. PCC 6714]